MRIKVISISNVSDNSHKPIDFILMDYKNRKSTILYFIISKNINNIIKQLSVRLSIL
ncbi:MAG: hypothetical protein FD170_1868 [Bacteroidetes bacterium]|nr:MAG: hypothetical protein FD170_1868 [Bacteroidota bacterium]